MSNLPKIVYIILDDKPFKVGDTVTLIHNKHGFWVLHRSYYNYPVETHYGFKVKHLKSSA